MKKLMCMILIIVSTVVVNVSSGFARHEGGGRGWGPGWGPVIGLGLGLGLWELSHPYYPYPYYDYYAPPVIIQQPSPDVYIQSAPQTGPVPSAQEPVYWYYCQEPPGYYPYVKQCPKGWMKVVPAPPAP